MVPYIINHLHFSAWKLFLLGCSSRRTKINTFIKTFPDYYLKEQCHEDFQVLAQFCAKIITSRCSS